MHIPDAALGSIVAALIGALVVFLGSVLTKEQKTSEFRQVWIDGLRNDLADYIGQGYELMGLVDELANSEDKPTLLAVMTTHHDRLEKLKIAETRILLRLNPVEHKAYAKELTHYFNNLLGDLALERARTPSETDGIAPKNARTNALVKASQLVLKKEWKRVKDGEPIFRWTKWTALTVFIFAVCAGATIGYWKYTESDSAPAAASKGRDRPLSASR